MNISRLIYTFLIIFYISVFNIHHSFSAIEMMTDGELAEVDGQFSEISIVNHNQENDTVRIFLDIHNEIYGTIDSIKAGYYYKDSSQLRTTSIQIGLSGFERYYHEIDTINNGANFAFMKVLSDFNTMAPQNGATLEPWGNGAHDASNPEATVTKNINNFDWDLWIDNMQIGESPDKPLYANGTIIRLEFDSNILTSQSPHLQRIIVGSNDSQGNMYANVQRMTGAMNGLLVTGSTNRSASAVDPYKWIGGVTMFQRDPMAQSFSAAIISNVEDRDMANFLIIDLEGDHLGLSLAVGYPENATDFSYHISNGSTGLEGIDVFDPSWAPFGESGLGGSDPYQTARQEEYVNNDEF